MTLPRRTTPTEPPQTRTDAARARRKQREAKTTWNAARTADQIREAVQKATTMNVRTVKRTPTGGTRTVRRQWMPGAPQAQTSRPRSTAAAASIWPQFQLGWRAVSLTIVMLLGSLLLRMLTSPEYFINSINLAGSQYVPGEEIYQASGVNQLNALWVNPEQIKDRIEAVPGIKSAQITLTWPNDVLVEVIENDPVLAWSQGGQTLWVDQDGVVFPARGEVAGLLPIVVDDASGALPDQARIPPAVIAGAQQLKQLRSNIELLHYDAMNGLSYQDGRNWRGYFGVGTDMAVKLAVYETLINNLLARGIRPTMISVIDKDAPYYRK